MELLISVSRLRLDHKSKQSLAFLSILFFVGATLHKGSARHHIANYAIKYKKDWEDTS